MIWYKGHSYQKIVKLPFFNLCIFTKTSNLHLNCLILGSLWRAIISRSFALAINFTATLWLEDFSFKSNLSKSIKASCSADRGILWGSFRGSKKIFSVFFSASIIPFAIHPVFVDFERSLELLRSWIFFGLLVASLKISSSLIICPRGISLFWAFFSKDCQLLLFHKIWILRFNRIFSKLIRFNRVGFRVF